MGQNDEAGWDKVTEVEAKVKSCKGRDEKLEFSVWVVAWAQGVE